MHVGTSIFFQNRHQNRTDLEVYQNELRLADLAEPLGYESIWGVEHHFTDYTMCPDVLQFLSYMAGRTEKVQLGSMVVVLPWHDPVRVAEQFSMLDHLSGGRAVVGVGRGLARVEFDGFQVSMAESRTRFAEGKELRPFDGKEHVLEFALKADFALLRAKTADTLGNMVYEGAGRNWNPIMAMAAAVTVAEVDQVVEPGGLDPELVITQAIFIDRLVLAG